jgi:hypothetical protein
MRLVISDMTMIIITSGISMLMRGVMSNVGTVMAGHSSLKALMRLVISEIIIIIITSGISMLIIGVMSKVGVAAISIYLL